MKPVIPFEPVSTEHIPSGSQWISQIKWDGVRMLAYWDGRELRLVNRSLNERTMQYPELAVIKEACRARSCILDGEIIAFDNSRPSFHEIMRRDSIRKEQNVGRMTEQVPVVYMIFDMLYIDGQWVTERSLQERQRLLEAAIEPAEQLRTVDNYENGEQLFDVMRQHGMEGIISKDLTSAYAVNGKDARWQKKKYIRDLIAIVGGVTYRDGTVNALMLGLLDEQGDLHYIGHAGTGRLSVQDWKAITAAAESIRIPHKPFKDTPERSKGAAWVKPILKVKVNYLEWTIHRTLRQPSIQAFVEAEDKACGFNQA
jgi:bifunctional non-homologous end joining protein LigD